MNPYVEKKFRDIYQSNPDLFAQKDYQKIQDIFNSKGGHNIPDVKIVPNLVNSISFEEPFVGIEDEESKKKKDKADRESKVCGCNSPRRYGFTISLGRRDLFIGFTLN